MWIEILVAHGDLYFHGSSQASYIYYDDTVCTESRVVDKLSVGWFRNFHCENLLSNFFSSEIYLFASQVQEVISIFAFVVYKTLMMKQGSDKGEVNASKRAFSQKLNAEKFIIWVCVRAY